MHACHQNIRSMLRVKPMQTFNSLGSVVKDDRKYETEI